MTTQYATITFATTDAQGKPVHTRYTVASPAGGFLPGGTPAPSITVTGQPDNVGYLFTIHDVGTIIDGQNFPQVGATTFTVPAPPTNTGINFMAYQRAMVSFTPPANDGGYPITEYTVTSNPGNVVRTGSASPVIVPGLTNGVPYTFTVTATNALGSSVPSTPTNIVTPAPQTFSTMKNIQYGSDPLQFVNLYVPDVDIAGTVMRVHGGGWSSGNVSPTWPSPTVDDVEISKLAAAGYAVLDVNYRGKNSSDGSNGNGVYPNNISDIETVMNFCLTSGAGAAWSPWWQTIYDFLALHGGLVVSGISAGSHLVTMGVCNYGQATGKWPMAVISKAGPYNIDYSTIFVEPMVQTLVINDYATTQTDRNNASPYFQFGTQAAPGRWQSAVTSSNCKFHFVHNNRDTLVTLAMSLPMIQNFQSVYSANTVVELVDQGPPLGSFNPSNPINFLGATPDNTTATLPSIGQQIGDAYIVSGIIWVYNQGTFAGDGVNPASVNGFTRWFDHNFSVSEVDDLIRIANSIFFN